MTVKKSTPMRATKMSEVKRIFLTLIILSLMGWFILICLAIFIWLTHGFESAHQAIQHLSKLNVIPHPIVYEQDLQLLDVMRFWHLLRATGYVMLTKLTLLESAIPLFFLSMMAGLIDGLNQRAIRAACLGRESTYVFHKSVPIARKSMCFVLGLWLCLPVSLPPEPIFVSLAILLGFVTRMSASRFKKYL